MKMLQFVVIWDKRNVSGGTTARSSRPKYSSRPKNTVIIGEAKSLASPLYWNVGMALVWAAPKLAAHALLAVPEEAHRLMNGTISSEGYLLYLTRRS
jgi:hypothetical protein